MTNAILTHIDDRDNYDSYQTDVFPLTKNLKKKYETGRQQISKQQSNNSQRMLTESHYSTNVSEKLTIKWETDYLIISNQYIPLIV